MENSKLKRFLLKNAFPLFGLGALIWFLIRVIPKPSRASYPCMRVAAPMASSFVLWLISLGGIVALNSKLNKSILQKKYFKVTLILLLLSVTVIINLNSISNFVYGKTVDFSETVEPLSPIGEAKGIFPGRVVWIWDSTATNENCTNSHNGNGITDNNDDGWFLDKNNNQEAIDSMLVSGLLKLTEADSPLKAWDSIFRYFNKSKHMLDVGYNDPQKIFIKVNSTSSWGYGTSWGNINLNKDIVENNYYGVSETSPQLVLSLLRQLINICGISEENIYVGDPIRNVYNHCFDKWNNEFPNVHYVNQNEGEGRELVIKNDEPSIFYSDRGAQLSETTDTLYSVMTNADYLINIPQMKAHALGGVTLFPKNHFGSHTRDNARHLHPGIIAVENGVPTRTDSSLYRVQVDLMGHEKIGGNQLLFLLDALWAGSEAVDPPTKWDLEPFNHDWTSSIFLSQDMVAIESVAYDFLAAEYDGSSIDGIQKVNYPHMKGTTDYLRQAASSEFWPEGIIYDPENDGIPISSLGVNEHWNNKYDKQYSRNLETGEGIELVFFNNNLQKVNSPTLISAANTSGSDIAITWIDNSDNEEGFLIERRDTISSSRFVEIATVNANQTSFVDTSEKVFNSYYYRVAAFNQNNEYSYSDSIYIDNISIVNVKLDKSNYDFVLYQNYPNPFNPTTTIKYVILNAGDVKICLLDILGNKLKEMVNSKHKPGVHSINFNAENLPSGVYFYRIESNNFKETKKMILLK